MCDKEVRLKSFTDSSAVETINTSPVSLFPQSQAHVLLANSELILNSESVATSSHASVLNNEKVHAPASSSQNFDTSSRKKRQFRQYCAALNCNASTMNSPNTSFFRFPKDKERCQRWLINISRHDLSTKSSVSLYHGSRLCGKHFEDSMFSNSIKTRLYSHAVPTIIDIHSSPKSLKRTLVSSIEAHKMTVASQCDQILNPKSLLNETTYTSTPSHPEGTVSMENDINISPNVLKPTLIVDGTSNDADVTINKPETKLSVSSNIKAPEVIGNGPNCASNCMCIECQPENYKMVATQTEPFVCTKEEKKRVAIQIKMLKRKIRNLERKLQRTRERLERDPEISTEKAMEKLKTDLPEQAYYLLQSMLKRVMVISI
ncbi:hypothetical protein CHUAL_014098 [Chamberlinius hualienensis]